MNEYLVLALDGLIYVAAYLLLVGLTGVCARLFYRGHSRAGWMAAVLSVVVVGAAKGFLDSQAGKWLPDLNPYAQLSAGLGATLVVACLVVYWRFATSFLSSAATALVLVLGMYGVSFALPWVSERALPPGMRMAQFIDSAYTRTREAREAAVNFKTVNDGAAAMLAASLHALADLSSKENFEAVKKEFASGVKLYADRKAEWDAMTPEEREANRKAMAEFMAEQGLAADRYSLSALKRASMDDVKNLVAFMKEMKAENAAAQGSSPAPAEHVRPPLESMQILLRNIRGMKFTDEDHEAMATLSKIFFEKGIDSAIANARAELAAEKINPEWAGTLLAAMMETKSGVPVALMVGDESTQALPEPAPAATEPRVAGQPVVRMIALPIKFGYVRVPKGTRDIDEISAAAETIPVTGFLSGGARVRVALGKTSLGLGEIYRVSRGAKTYAFKVEEVTDGQVYVSASFGDE